MMLGVRMMLGVGVVLRVVLVSIVVGAGISFSSPVVAPVVRVLAAVRAWVLRFLGVRVAVVRDGRLAVGVPRGVAVVRSRVVKARRSRRRVVHRLSVAHPLGVVVARSCRLRCGQWGVFSPTSPAQREGDSKEGPRLTIFFTNQEKHNDFHHNTIINLQSSTI